VGGPSIPGWPFGNHKSARNHTPATFVCGLQGGHAPYHPAKYAPTVTRHLKYNRGKFRHCWHSCKMIFEKDNRPNPMIWHPLTHTASQIGSGNFVGEWGSKDIGRMVGRMAE